MITPIQAALGVLRFDNFWNSMPKLLQGLLPEHQSLSLVLSRDVIVAWEDDPSKPFKLGTK